ncbi:sugar transferase [Eggerthellaceae bacterium 24-137]
MTDWRHLAKKYGVSGGIYARKIKRILDMCLTSVGLIVISPLFLGLCLLVKAKLGSPIFFKQKRTTKGEETFELIKFRTMTDARDANGNLLPDTERFTKFGMFLRSSSLDELPELINVIRGDMSLVGPRPLYPFYLPYYTEQESLRHAVRGGITGLAQVNGRSLLRWSERFAMDVEYVKKITFLGDLKILFLTFYKVFKRDDIGVPSVTEEGGLHIVREVMRPECMKDLEVDPNCPKFVQGVSDIKD